MINFSITTPEREVFRDTVDSITLPTMMGEITILPHHIPLVAALVPGVATVRKNSHDQYLAVSGGFIEVRSGSQVVVLADTAERAEELSEEKIEAARARAREVLAGLHDREDVAFAQAASLLERELARLKVARKYRPKL